MSACRGVRVCRVWVCVLAALLPALLGAAARSEHVVASRRALVKSDPERNAEVIRELERGQALPLASSTQTDGYYKVRLSSRKTGWVYRTFVRRLPGPPPAPADDEDTPVTDPTDDTASTELTSGAGIASPFAFEGVPVSLNPNFPVRVLHKQFFAVGYSEARCNPMWVCYSIGPALDLTPFGDKHFNVDKGTEARVSHNDYTNTGFSRGHMAPRFAIASRFNEDGNNATFIMSNVCPQFQDFNDGQWGDLEEWVAGKNMPNGSFIRGWADVFGQVWVTVGPIFDKDREPIARDEPKLNIAVPNAFYCIVVDVEGTQPRALAFIMEHKDQREGEPDAALTSIDTVEERTGLDFFTGLPDEVEASLEAARAAELWPLPRNPN